MNKMGYERFAAALERLLRQLPLTQGRMKWFSNAVGLDDRYLRRWTSGHNLPSEDSWKTFLAAVRRDFPQVANLEQSIHKIQGQLDSSLRQRSAQKRKPTLQPGTLACHGFLVASTEPRDRDYIQWLTALAHSLDIHLRTTGSTGSSQGPGDMLVILTTSQGSLPGLLRWVGNFAGRGKPVCWLIGPDAAIPAQVDESAFTAHITLNTADDLSPVVALLDTARRLTRQSENSTGSGHLCMRKNADLEVNVGPSRVVTTTELQVQSLVDGLSSLHHGIVVPDKSPEVDLSKSKVTVASLTAGHSLKLVDVLKGIRTFQFAASVSPMLPRGGVLNYRYVFTCPNYFPLSKKEVIERQNKGHYHLSDPCCEKSYTITAPTQRLTMRILLPRGIPPVVAVFANAATWKSDSMDQVETIRLKNQECLKWRRFRNHDELTLTVPSPRLFARYRVFWEYST